MKIRDIKAVGLRGATPEGGWTEEIRPDECVQTLLFVLTDEGPIGTGSVFTNDALVKGALQVLEPLALGESALEPDRVTEKLHQHTFWMGRGGAITHTISGINIALWDLLGQCCGQPVGRLIGGRYRDRVRPYASLLMSDSKALTDQIEALKERGFRAFKIGWGRFGRDSSTWDEAVVAAARQAAGDDADLMVDAGGSDAFWPNGYAWAARTARMLLDFGVTWFEEPLSPDLIDDFVALRRLALLPISGGEVLTRRQAFTPWLERGAFDIVQPDVTKVGGITESRRIAEAANERGVRYIPHGWNTAVGLACDLQLASAFATTDRVEYIIGSPYVDELKTGGWDLDQDGSLAIPDEPGIGLELDTDAVRRYGGEDVGDWLSSR